MVKVIHNYVANRALRILSLFIMVIFALSIIALTSKTKVSAAGISYVCASSAAATSSAACTGEQNGDLLVVFAYRSNSATAPTLATGFTQINTTSNSSGGTNGSMRAGWIVASASTTTSGTWTNATHVAMQVYRNQNSSPIGNNAVTGGNNSGTTVSYPATTLSVGDGSSWFAGFAGRGTGQSVLATAPSGMTNRTSAPATPLVAGHDTNAGTATNWSTTSVSGFSASSKYVSLVVEIKAAPTANLTQDHYRWRNDDGSETSASWRRAEDTSATANTGVVRRLRIQIANLGAATASSTTYRLEYGLKSSTCSAIGSWTAVPVTATTEKFQLVNSTYYTDGAATTAQLTAGNTTFVAGQVKDTGNTTSGISLTTTQYTEVEYALTATSNAATLDDYCFRVTNAGDASLFTYSTYAELVIGDPIINQNHYRWRNDDGGESSGGSVVAGATSDSTPLGATGWTNTTAAYGTTADTTYATATPSGKNVTDTTDYSGYGFNIPSSASITAVTVKASYHVSTTSSIATFNLTPGYISGTTAYCSANTDATEPTTDTTFSVDVSACTAWTPASVNNIVLETAGTRGNSNTAVTFSLDFTEIDVSYTITPASYVAAADTAVTGATTGQSLRLRFEAANTGASAANRNLLLEYAQKTGGTCSGLAYSAVPTTSGSDFQMATSSYFTNGDPTTTQLSATGTYTAGVMVASPSNSSGGGVLNIGNGNYTEVEYIFSSAGTAVGKNYCLRLSDNGTDLDTYTQYAEIGFLANGPTIDQVMRGGTWFSNGTKQSQYWSQ